MGFGGDLKEAIDILKALSPQDQELIILLLLAFTTGFLILFYFRRLRTLDAFKKLDIWERLMWTLILGSLNLFISIIMVGFGLIISFIIFPSYGSIIASEITSLLNFSLLIVPMILYGKTILKKITLKEFKNSVFYFVLGIFLIIFLAYAEIPKSLSFGYIFGTFIFAILILIFLTSSKYIDGKIR